MYSLSHEMFLYAYGYSAYEIRLKLFINCCIARTVKVKLSFNRFGLSVNPANNVLSLA
jgi:hypothetical protein